MPLRALMGFGPNPFRGEIHPYPGLNALAGIDGFWTPETGEILSA